MKKALKITYATLFFLAFTVLIFAEGFLISFQAIKEGFDIYDYITFPIFILQLLALIFFVLSIKIKINRSLNQNLNIQSLIITDILNFGGLGYLIYDSNGIIIWINNYFLAKYQNEFVGKHISVIGIKDVGKIETETIQIKNSSYRYKIIPSLRTILLKDISLFINESERYDDETMAIGLVNIDNYNKIINSSNEKQAYLINKKIVSLLLTWCWNNNIFIKKLSSIEQYLIISSKKTLIKLKKEGKIDELVSDIIANAQKLNININFTIGIAFGVNNPTILYNEAVSATELALSRGGDQLIIRDVAGYENTYFGSDKLGKGDVNRHKLKQFSQRIIKVIKNSKLIYITGHIYPDYDSFGACLGIYLLCKALGTKAKIVVDPKNIEQGTRDSIIDLIGKKEYREIFIKSKLIVPSKINSKTTSLFILDTSSKGRVVIEELTNKLKNTVIIDHHLISESEYLLVSDHYIDTFSSSTCEIVTELLSYEESVFQKYMKDFSCFFSIMLAGIITDTNNFKYKTSSKTFELASLLKKWGADEKDINELLKESLKTTNLISNLLNNSYMATPQACLSFANDNSVYERKILSIAAQQLINIKGITISIVVGMTSKNTLGASCRSIGNSLNVQKFAEIFNGGGHFNAAAFELKNTTFAQAKKIITKELKKSLATIKNNI